MTRSLTLVSHTLCPYVQRAAIVLHEKGVAFERRNIDLANKPEWFLKVSPMGRTPVLLVGNEPIFESAVICDYLDETTAPRLHPEPALERARHRAWVAFGSEVLGTIAAFYNAADENTLLNRASDIRARFVQLEAALRAGPYFGGAHFAMVDAVFGPVFRYFDVFDRIADFGCFTGLPKVQAWRQALSERASVREAVDVGYTVRLMAFLAARPSALSRRMATVSLVA